MLFKSLVDFFRFIFTSDHDKILKKRISKIKGKVIASTVRSQIHIEYHLLNNHSFAVVNITGSLNIDTNKGCTLIFEGKNKLFAVNSDSDMVIGQYGEDEKIGLTKFDINITTELIEFVNSNTIKKINLEVQNGHVLYVKETFEFSEINQPELISVIGSLD